MLEAMKMEHVVVAPGAGVITSLTVQVGETVAAGALLATIEPGDDDEPDGSGAAAGPRPDPPRSG